MSSSFPLPMACPVSLSLRIESAYHCDGSVCHQPMFNQDGSLHYVAPHSHLVERNANGSRCYAVFCDFPALPEV
jgi:hypothetical protein